MPWLQDEVLHQLLACLHHVGVPTKVTLPQYAPGGPAEQQATAALVAHFRENCRLPHPLPLPPILEEEAAAEEPETEPAPKVCLKKINMVVHRASWGHKGRLSLRGGAPGPTPRGG